MTFTAIRRLIALQACLVLTGCSSLPMTHFTSPTETELFATGMDQYIESRDLTKLKLLSKQYPQGEWRTRAEGLIEIAEQQDQLKNKLTRSEKEKEVLRKNNMVLEETLEQLKQVLIDMELRKE